MPSTQKGLSLKHSIAQPLNQKISDLKNRLVSSKKPDPRSGQVSCIAPSTPPLDQDPNRDTEHNLVQDSSRPKKKIEDLKKQRDEIEKQEEKRLERKDEQLHLLEENTPENMEAVLVLLQSSVRDEELVTAKLAELEQEIRTAEQDPSRI